MKWVTIVAVVLVLGVGGWFVFANAGKWQKQFSEKADKEAKEGDGGEMGHIANVYDALDATDPDKGFGERGGSSGPPRRSGGGARADADDEVMAGEKELPIVPAVWTLDLDSGKIPQGRVNGTVAGGKFVCDSARLEVVGNAVVLSLRQGEDLVPEREILVYLHLKAGEKLGGGSWNVTKEMKGASVPQVAKRWKIDPKFSPALKSFATGYAMKLELGPIRDGELKGKVFVALPDTEQSVAAGIFTAETSLPDTPVNPATAAAKP